ncbi:hypothetical protein VTK26DRAFT_2491 [Humicola hyalothermophila]
MAPKKTDTKAEGAATTKTKASPSHPTYQDMITDAIIALKDRNGSSRQSLKKYVRANNNIVATDKMFDALFNKALKAGVEKGVFEQPKGPSGGTKLAKKTAKPAAPKKAAPKKDAAAKEGKEKKAATKKAAPKKETATKKEAAPKKAAAPKKEKKAAAPKKAPAVVDKPTVLTKTKSGRVAKTAAKPAPAKKAAPKKAATKKATTKKAEKGEATA